MRIFNTANYFMHKACWSVQTTNVKAQTKYGRPHCVATAAAHRLLFSSTACFADAAITYTRTYIYTYALTGVCQLSNQLGLPFVKLKSAPILLHFSPFPFPFFPCGMSPLAVDKFGALRFGLLILIRVFCESIEIVESCDLSLITFSDVSIRCIGACGAQLLPDNGPRSPPTFFAPATGKSCDWEITVLHALRKPIGINLSMDNSDNSTTTNQT